MYNYYGSSFENYVSLAVVILIIGIIWRVVNRNKIYLALTQFKIDPEADSQVVIEGRKTGFIQWLLVQLKLGNMYKIHVKKNYISYASESINGEDLILTPLQKIASTACGFRKPIIWLILAGIFFLMGLISLGSPVKSMFIFFILIGLIFVLAYHFKKNFFISIQTVGGHSFELSFKRSLFENIPVNLTYVKQAIEHINNLVLEVQ